jgi:hypothetical protein
LKVDSCL